MEYLDYIVVRVAGIKITAIGVSDYLSFLFETQKFAIIRFFVNENKAVLICMYVLNIQNNLDSEGFLRFA